MGVLTVCIPHDEIQHCNGFLGGCVGAYRETSQFDDGLVQRKQGKKDPLVGSWEVPKLKYTSTQEGRI